MPAHITIEVVRGQLTGKRFGFADYATCIIGRALDCNIRLPDDRHHRKISRNHCLLDINPPDIRIRDFGSLNGTFVNGRKIGQRKSGQTPSQGAQQRFPEHDLKDGDEIQLGETVFRVTVRSPVVCADCGKEISEKNRLLAKQAPGVYRCDPCVRRAGSNKPPASKNPVCARCGKNVAGEIGANRPGDYLCKACRSDPLALVKRMVGQAARQGAEHLLAIRGYAIVKELGRGGMGAVYLARHEATGRTVALKVMLPKVAAQERAKAMFLREADNTRALDHPGIVRLWDAGCSDGTFFFTLEFCNGGSVDHLMARHGGTLPVDTALAIVFQALDGLDYAHQAPIPCVKLKDGTIGKGRGLVHRDLKPANIFLSRSGHASIAKLADFGLAKAFDTAGLSGQTRTGSASGTPFFMPRQQVINFKYAKPEVDIWAMAASLYNMLTGAYPRSFSRGKDVWQTALQSDAVPIRQRNRSVPEKLAGAIDAALVDRPAIGFKTAAQFKQALESAL